MKPLRDLQKLLRRAKGPVFVIVALVAIGAAVGGWALLPVRAQQPQAIPIRVNGETVWLEPGKNVHPQTYEFLSRNPGPDWHANTTWVYVDEMWIPFAKGIAPRPDQEAWLNSLPKWSSSDVQYAPEYDPDCRWSLSVTAYWQGGDRWSTLPACDASCTLTMTTNGCYVTSAAMVFGYFGCSKNPGQLQQCLDLDIPGVGDCCGGSGDCFTDGVCAASRCSDNTTTLVGDWAFDPPVLCALLSQGKPPIVMVRTQLGNDHYVVVWRSLGNNPNSPSDYIVNDPWDGSTYKSLAYWPECRSITEHRRR